MCDITSALHTHTHTHTHTHAQLYFYCSSVWDGSNTKIWLLMVKFIHVHCIFSKNLSLSLGASFSEHFYGLKRVPCPKKVPNGFLNSSLINQLRESDSTTSKLSSRQVIGSLLTLVRTNMNCPHIKLMYMFERF
jgi:hypothetical protein